MPQFFPSLHRAWYRSAVSKSVLMVLVTFCVMVFLSGFWQREPWGMSLASQGAPDELGVVKTSKDSAELATSSGQFAYQRDVEQHLARKAEDLLDGVLGVERAVVRVTAEMRFQPPHQARQVDQESHNNQPSNDPSQGAKRQHVGTIERLSIAVMLIAPKSPDGDRVAESLAASLPDIEAIVKQAVGFKAGRDVLQISLGTPLTDSAVGASGGPMAQHSFFGDMYLLATVMVALAFVLLTVLAVWRQTCCLPVEAPRTAPNATEDLRDLPEIAAVLRHWVDGD